MARFVLVHGAFAGPWIWDAVAAELRQAGHAVHAVSLPSCGTDPAALGGLPDDIVAVRDAVETPARDHEAGHSGCVLVGHSYGGFVVTELADHPDVVHTVYVAAFWPQRHQTLLDLFGAGPLPAWAVPRADGALEMSTELDVVRDALANDLTTEAASALHSRFGFFSAATFTVPSTAPARGHRTTYVVTELDHAIPPAAQEQMATQADQVAHLATSHQPMLAQPAALAALLNATAE